MLPPEIIFDIASRVPPKSIGRFRCVSTQWRTLLSQPNFIKAHTNRLTKQLLILPEESLILGKSSNICCAPFSNNIAHHLFDEMSTSATQLNVVTRMSLPHEGCAACDGLVLLVTDAHKLLLINPTTKETRELPDPPYPLNTIRNPNYNFWGIGYDNATDDYKIITFTHAVHINVFSVRNGTWKAVECSKHDRVITLITSGVLLNGFLHWIGITGNYSPAIIGFDLVEDKFCKVPTPSSITANGSDFVYNRLVVLDGCLSYFSTLGKDSNYSIWMMKEYGVEKSWTEVQIVEPEGLPFRPLTCLLGQPEVLVEKDDEMGCQRLAMYNLDSGTWEGFVVHGVTIADYEFHVRGTFLETLLSPY